MAWWTDDSPIPDPAGKGERAVAFVERLRLQEGRFAGRRFKLARWQRRIVQRIYGDVDERGRRVVRTVFVLLPRGNGKTTLCSALALLHLFGPASEGAGQVIAAAADREQASIAYRSALGMVEQDQTLLTLTRRRPSTKEIAHPKSRSLFKAISHEAYSKHGMSISFLIADEVHAWPTRELWDVLTQSMGKRDEPLTLVITTAGSGVHGLAAELYAYAKKVAAGEVIDPTFLPVLYEPEPGADWRDEAVWNAVNPALADGFRSLDEMRMKARQAVESPGQLEAFRRYYLNFWSDGAAAPWLDMDVYDAGAAPIDASSRRGEACWVGVDLSSTSDLTAVVQAFRDPDGGYTVLPHFFVPAESLRRRQERDQVPYLDWAAKGFLTATEGNVVDYDFVEARIEQIARDYRVLELAIDPAMAAGTTTHLLDRGLPVVEFRQGWRSMTPAVKETERAILSRRFRHGGHPVLRWCFQNAVIDPGPAGDTARFSKNRSAEKIDGAVAAAMAVARAHASDTMPSVYETARPDGILFF